MYKELMKEKLNKVLRDELTASISYLLMAENTTLKTLACELREHADEEYGHFKQLISYAHNHSLGDDLTFEIDYEVLDNAPLSDTAEMIMFTQTIETVAINDYKEIALLARENDDLETEEIFIDLMKYEQKHFDDLAQYTQETRELPEKPRIVTFKQMIGLDGI